MQIGIVIPGTGEPTQRMQVLMIVWFYLKGGEIAMKEIIYDMVREAERTENYELIALTKRLIDELTVTINIPSKWRAIAGELCKDYSSETSWVREELELWNFE